MAWTILILVVLVSLMNIHHLLIDIAPFALGIANWTLNSFIPTIPIIVCNVFLYNRLKALLNSDFYSSGCNAELQKTIFRTKVTMLIASIFISSQVLLWIQIVIEVVSFENHKCRTLDSGQLLHFRFTRSITTTFKKMMNPGLG